MVTEMLWKKIETIELINERAFLSEEDVCYYAREYVSHGGFAAGAANNLISNFKKPRNTYNTSQWRHKLRAVKQFAEELSEFLPDPFPTDCAVSTIPTSKHRNDPEFDPRFDLLEQELAQLRTDIRVERPIERDETVEASHVSQETRNVDNVLSTLSWIGFDVEPSRLVLVDDVITCGTQFKACQRLIQQHHSDMEVTGVFWTKTIWSTSSNAPN